MPHFESRWFLLSLLVSGACFAGSAAQATFDSIERQMLGKPRRSIADDKP